MVVGTGPAEVEKSGLVASRSQCGYPLTRCLPGPYARSRILIRHCKALYSAGSALEVTGTPERHASVDLCKIPHADFPEAPSTHSTNKGKRKGGATRPRPFALVTASRLYLVTFREAENSDVSSLADLVDVAVTVWPTDTALAGEKAKETLPLASVLTLVCPMNFLPSSPEGLE